MSNPRTFLLCDSPEHAALVDGMVCESLREEDGNKGSQWSGIYVRPADPVDIVGILWAPEVAAVFGTLADDPLLQLEAEVIDETGESNWGPLPPPDDIGV